MNGTKYDDIFVSARNFRKPSGVFRYFPLSKKVEIITLSAAVLATAFAVLFVMFYVNDTKNWPSLVQAAAFCLLGIVAGPVFLILSSRTRRKAADVFNAVESMGKRLMSFDDILAKTHAVKPRELTDILARLFFDGALQNAWVNVKKELLEKIK